MMKKALVCLLVLLIGLLGACSEEPGPTDADVRASVEAGVAATSVAQTGINTAVAQTVTAQTEAGVTGVTTPTVEAPSTFTPEPPTDTPESTPTEPPTSTPPATLAPPATPTVPTNTPVPTDTPPPPTDTPAPAQPAPTQPPPPPPPPANPVYGGDMLPNGSFEGGWYNMWGIPELQLPNGWVFEWDEGPTGFGSEVWDQWYRPETRVLPYFQLPGSEQGLFIQDGEYTIKIFKGNGPISFRIYRDVELPAGSYVFRIRAFPDLVSSYNNNNKVWAGDPNSGEIRFITPDGGTGWIYPAFGTWNVLEHTFTLDQPQTVRLGIGVRGRYALQNNGWFFDDWDLQRLEGG